MKYKLITHDEKKQFIEAWIDSFNREYHQIMYEWMFYESNYMYGVFDGETIVAGYCLLKQSMIYNQIKCMGALCNNVFVRPEYRGLNLFVKLGRYALSEAEKNGIEVVIGIPNENAVIGHRRVGWTLQKEIHFLEKELNHQKIFSDEHIVTLNLENYKEHENALETLSLNLSKDRTFSIIKDRSYFKWRYLLKPLVDYRIYLYISDGILEGYMVIKLYEALKRVHVIDIEANSSASFDGLLDQINAFGDTYDLVNVWDTSAYHELFLKNGFHKSEESNNLIAKNLQEKGAFHLKDDINIVLGDNEVF